MGTATTTVTGGHIRQAESLLARGYCEVESEGGLTAGRRVRHTDEQWPAAAYEGTAVVERIFRRSDRNGHVRDVEVIVRRDRPFSGHLDAYGFWAAYDTVPVTPLFPEAAAGTVRP